MPLALFAKQIPKFKMSANQYASDDLRQKGYDLLYSNLEMSRHEHPDATDEFLEDIAFKIEESVYQECPITKNYKDRLRSVGANIKYTPNALNVRKRLFTGEWSPEEFGKMSPEEMYPELKQREKEDTEEEDRLTQYFLDKKMAVKSFYTCGKCKSDKVEHTQRQTRSSDEPMTVFCNCLNCGKRWKC